MTIAVKSTVNGNWEVSGELGGPGFFGPRVFDTKKEAIRFARRKARKDEKIVANFKSKPGFETIKKGRQ